MSKRRIKNQFTTGIMLVILSTTCGCSTPEKKDDFAGLIKAAQTARTSGHEDLAANCLKEAFEKLPAKDNAVRAQAINQIYPEILALAADLQKLGRFSLSKTILDKAIEIESECTIEGKQSAVAVKEETEKVGELEINLLKRADKSNELKAELKQLKHTTKDLVKQFHQGNYSVVAHEGRAHLEVLRKTRGVPSNAYCDARNLVIDSLVYEDNIPAAIKLLEDDVPELSNFKDEDLTNADDEAIEAALFLSPLLGQIGDLQVKIGKYDEAEKNAKRSFDLAQILGGKLHPTSAFSLTTLALVKRMKGQEKEALEYGKKAIPYYEKAKKRRGEMIRCLLLIAQSETALGQTHEAKKVFDRLVNQAEHRQDRGTSSIVMARAAAFYRAQGDEERYRNLSDKAIKFSSQKGEPRNSIVATYDALGEGAVRMSKFTEAERFYTTALKYADKFQKVSLEKKIEMCKRNRSVTS